MHYQIHRHGEPCILFGDDCNAFGTEADAQAYLDRIHAHNAEHHAPRVANPAMLRDGWSIVSVDDPILEESEVESEYEYDTFPAADGSVHE